MIAAVALAVLLLAALVWERRERSSELRVLVQAHALERGELLAVNERERERWASERADLLQRIQAPEQAVIDHSVAQTPQVVLPPIFGMDDDDALAESKEALAERLAELEVAA